MKGAVRLSPPASAAGMAAAVEGRGVGAGKGGGGKEKKGRQAKQTSKRKFGGMAGGREGARVKEMPHRWGFCWRWARIKRWLQGMRKRVPSEKSGTNLPGLIFRVNVASKCFSIWYT